MTKRGVDDSLIICLFYYLSTKWEMILKDKDKTKEQLLYEFV